MIQENILAFLACASGETSLQPIRETPMCLIVFIIQVFQLRLVWICNEPSEPIEQPFRDEKTLYKYKTSGAKVGIS